MTCVIVAADEQDKPFFDQLAVWLSSLFPSVVINRRRMSAWCDNAELIITDTESFDEIQSDQQVVIFKGIKRIDTGKLATGKAIAIVDSFHSDLLFISQTKLPVITCGLSSKDTVTLSSINTDSAVVNLQRTVTCFDGSEAEPQEIPVKLTSPLDDFMLMVIVSVSILFGKTDRLLEAEKNGVTMA